MITEDYVSFEVAKLLKEKGFEILTDKVYDNQNKLDYQCAICFVEERLPYVSAPTLQMAMKWLREKHKYLIVVGNKNGNYLYLIKNLKTNTDLGISNEEYIYYEEACEAAIKHCLENLI